MRNDTKYAIAMIKTKSFYPWLEPIPEEKQEWDYLAFDNGPGGSGEPIFSPFPNYRMYFNSPEEAETYWIKNRQTIYDNWQFFNTDSLCIRKFTTSLEKALDFR